MTKVETYKGYEIDLDLFLNNMYVVFYQGDDCVFKTLEKAREFIDEITEVCYE